MVQRFVFHRLANGMTVNHPYDPQRVKLCPECSRKAPSKCEVEAKTHYRHAAGWKPGGNQHPEISRWDPDHPDVVKGFYWTVDWEALRSTRPGAQEGRIPGEAVA
jgi:hypothetical protein